MNKKIIFLMGPQGSGKGTQGELLSKAIKLPLLVTGDVLRDEMKKETERGRTIKELYTRGELTPNEIVEELLLDAAKNYAAGFLLDGYPRNMEQAKGAERSFFPTALIAFELSDDDAVIRLSQRRICSVCQKVYHLLFNPPPQGEKCVCGGKLIQRSDDTEIAIRRRLEIYRRETEPVIDYFTAQAVSIVRINAAPPIEKVFQDLLKQLREKKILDNRCE